VTEPLIVTGTGAGDTASVGVDAMRELRATRRRRRIEELDWFEAAYRAYLAGILGIFVTLLLSSWLGDDPVDAEALADVTRYGPAAVGVAAALALGLGLRSGSRGGPLALERAEVRFVLMAPIDRREVLRGGAWRTVRHATFLGAVVGAIAGQLAGRRLGGSLWAWAGSGAAAGGLIAALFIGAALVASGLGLRRWLATVLAAAALGWAALDVFQVAPSPTTTLGSLSLWPLRVHWIDLAGAAAVVVIVLGGFALLGRVSLEEAERRTALVGQLRFAVTLQDLRTVLVLRRQLAQDLPRRRPWFHLGPAKRHPVWRRDWHGFLRFSAGRLIRLLLLAVGAGLCLRAAFEGIPPLIIVSGVALFLAGLEASEPMAQDVDQSERTDSLPHPRGDLLIRHVPSTYLLMALTGLVTGVALWVAQPSVFALELAAIVAVPAALCGAAGGVVSVVMGAPEPSQDGVFLPPEVAGMKIFFRAALPIVVSVLGGVSVVVAHRAQKDVDAGLPASPLGAAASAAILALAIATLVALYVRYRDAIKVWWKKTMEESQQAAQQRQTSRST
jgi:hypothetical protein